MFAFLIFAMVMGFLGLVGTTINMVDTEPTGAHIISFLLNLILLIWGCVLLF